MAPHGSLDHEWGGMKCEIGRNRSNAISPVCKWVRIAARQDDYSRGLVIPCFRRGEFLFLYGVMNNFIADQLIRVLENRRNSRDCNSSITRHSRRVGNDISHGEIVPNTECDSTNCRCDGVPVHRKIQSHSGAVVIESITGSWESHDS